MLIIGKPQNKEIYIKVSGELNGKLQNANFQPLFKDEDGFFYYLKTGEMLKFVGDNGF